MKQIKITLPSSWAEVSVKQYHEIRNNFNDKSLDAIDRDVSNICTLSGVDYSEIESLPIPTIKELANKISFIYSMEVQGEFPNKIFLGNRMFTVNPDIRVNYGQFKAMREYSKTEESVNDNLHKIVALFIYEENKTYDFEYENKCKLVYEHCKMDVVLRLCGFFLELLPEFVKVSRTYSLNRVEKIIQETAKQIEREIK